MRACGNCEWIEAEAATGRGTTSCIGRTPRGKTHGRRRCSASISHQRSPTIHRNGPRF